MILFSSLHASTSGPGVMLRGLFGNIDITESIGPGHNRMPMNHRLYRRADLRSCCTAFDPPELAAPGNLVAVPSSRPPSLGKLACRRGRAVLLTHNRDAKLAEIRPTAARIAQPGEAGRPARFGNICPLRPSMSRRQIFPSGSLPSDSRPDRLCLHRCSERFRQFKTPAQEDKVCIIV